MYNYTRDVLKYNLDIYIYPLKNLRFQHIVKISHLYFSAYNKGGSKRACHHM